MREIRFRAWHKNEGMLYNRSLNTVGQDKHYGEDAILMQYTGLKDENGIEIYEGDIVKVTSVSFGTRIGQVKFAKSAFWYDFGEQEDGYTSELVFMPIRAEVIGNVWANKELLE